jgi:hypothetical protein
MSNLFTLKSIGTDRRTQAVEKYALRLPPGTALTSDQQVEAPYSCRFEGNLMNRMLLAGLLVVFLMVPTGCKSETENNDAIRDGVIKHLGGMNGLNVNNMTVKVTKATINGDRAQADVDIRAKNGDPSSPAMQLTYDLQKQGDEWVVLKGESKGGMQHPTAGEMPPQGTLPPGHPAAEGTGGQMPANHPDFNSILNSAQPQPQPQSGQQPAQQPSGSKP